MIDPKSVPIESRRMPLETRVLLKFDRFSGFISEYSSNISQGGMFIRTQASEPVGTILDFGFRLGDGFELIHGRGVVVWVRENEESPDRPAGMGIRFLDLNQESRELILMMVENFVKQGGTPFDVAAVPQAPLPVEPAESDESSGISTEPPELVTAEPPPLAAPSTLPEISWPPFDPVFDRAVQPPRSPSALQPPEPVAARRPIEPVFASVAAPAGSRRWLLYTALSLAVLVVAVFTQWERLRLLISPPPASAAKAVPAPSASPPPPPSSSEPTPATEPAPPTSELSSASNSELPEPSEAPEPSGPAATRIQSITWEQIASGTEILIRGDGVIRGGSYKQTRIEGGAPRELIRLTGITAPYPKVEIPVATLQLRRIRIGYHQEISPPELHVVLDLAGPKVRMTLLEEENRQLRIRLKEPGPP